MCENRSDAENRTPFFPVPQNETMAPAQQSAPAGKDGPDRAAEAALPSAEAAKEPPAQGEPSLQKEAPGRSAETPPAADAVLPETPAPAGKDGGSTPAGKPSFFAHPSEKWALPAALWAGYLYCRMLFGSNDFRWPFHVYVAGENGRWFYILPLLLCAVYCTGVIVWCRLRRIRGSAESPLWLGCLLVTVAALGLDRLNASGWAAGWLAFHGFALVWTLARTGQLTENRTGPAFALDVLRGVGRGFAGLVDWLRGVIALVQERPRRSGKKRKNLLPVLLCVAGAAMLFVFAAKELSAADDRFGDWLQSIVNTLVFWQEFSVSGSVVVSLIFMFPVGAFFYGMSVAGRAAVERTPRPLPAFYAARLTGARQLPVGLVCGVLAVFAVLYLTFFGMQGGYLFGAFTHRLPQGFTVAVYARRGFFELCRVMLVNFALLLAVETFAAIPLRQSRPLRIAGAVLLGQSLLLWVTAASKLGLYIATFGFTAKRLLAAWALLVLAVACVRWMTGLWRRCSVLRPTVLVGAVSFALLCLY